MRLCIAAACLLLVSCADGPVQTEVSTSSYSSLYDGVFTAEQSQRGKLQYLKVCKQCHLRDLTGDFVEDAPPLVGEEFLANRATWTVGDLFEFLTLEMPPKPKDRRKVTAEIYADILAYVLDKNGFPAGQVELPPAFEPLVMIEMSPEE